MRCRSLLCLALLGLLAVSGFAEDGDELAQKVLEAEEAQEFREEPDEQVKSSIVKEAPEAFLANGDADVSTTDNCATDIDFFCLSVAPGEGRIAECLEKQIKDKDKGNSKGRKVSKACKDEVRQFKADRATNINKDLVLANACKKDAAKFCKDEAQYPEPGNIISCLREYKPKLSADCSAEVFRTMQDASEDFAEDAMLYALCKKDAERLCKDVEEGEGRIQACLREERSALSWECQEELFRQEVEDAEDIRLSVQLFNACLNDKKKFCADIPYGNGHIKDCLEEHRNSDDFGTECKDKLEAMMERRSRDFRLDAGLRDTCITDIENFCGYEMESLESVAGMDARVILCLQDYHLELKQEACKEQVHKVMMRASEDIRFDEPLADACYYDREKFCPGVVPGSARVIRCLQDARKDLSIECKAALFDHEVRMAEDIDFQFPMKKACTAEIEKFCEGIPHGHARVIACLQHKMDDADFGSECKRATQRLTNRMGQDYRLNYRLSSACESDIESLCSEQCSPFLGMACGGTVLRCLQDNADKVASSECRDEIFYFEQMEVSDFRNDVMLAEACRTDVTKFCSDVAPGEGRVHECLRANMQDLSEGCRKEEVKLGMVQASDVRLRPKLQKACAEEMLVYCKDVKPGKGRMFQCLMEKLAEADFGSSCRAEVEKREDKAKSDYRYDQGVATECAADIDDKCADAKAKMHGHAEVLKCLVEQFKTVAPTCQTEMSRATRLALWDYKAGAHFTAACDDDVAQLCPVTKESRHRGVFTIGAVGRCLSKQAAEGKPLKQKCLDLVAVAAPRDMRGMLDGTSATGLATRLAQVESAGVKAGLMARAPGGSFITLSGWVALVSIFAMILVLVVGAVFAYRRITGVDKPYTIVMDETAAPAAAAPAVKS